MAIRGTTSLLFLAALGGVFAASTASEAAKGKAQTPALAPYVEETDSVVLSDADYALIEARVRTQAGRKIAQANSAAAALKSSELNAAVARFQQIKTATDLQKFLDELDANYDKSPRDVQFLASVLGLLRPFQGFVYRVEPLASRSKLLHSQLITEVRSFASSYRVYFPTEQWDAGFEYVTRSAGLPEIKHENELQNFVDTAIRPALLKAAGRIDRLFPAKSNPPMIVWDNQFVMGTAQFQDDLDRYVLIGDAEAQAIIASLKFSTASALMATAYQAEGLVDLAKSLGKLYGFDAFSFKSEGVTEEERVATILRHQKKDPFWKLRVDGAVLIGSYQMRSALKHLRDAANRGALAWIAVKDQPANEERGLNPGLVAPFNRRIGLAINDIRALLKGEATLRSGVTGMPVTVNLPAFFENPPSNLSELLPTDFTKEKKVDTKVLRRDYYAGRGSQWNLDAYRKLFPKLTKQSEVTDFNRILSQTWGGAVLAAPMGPFVR